MSEAPPDPDRLLRRPAFVAGLALAVTLVCPFVARQELLPSVLLAIEMKSAAPVLIGVAGLIMLSASVMRRLRPDVRAGVCMGAAVLAIGAVYSFVLHPSFVGAVPYELRSLGLTAVELLLGSFFLALAFEVALARSVPSRPLSALTAVAWAFYLSRFFYPLDGGDDFEDSLAGVFLESVDELERHPGIVLLMLPLLLYFALPLFLLGRAVGRFVVDRAPKKRATARLPALLAGLPGALCLGIAGPITAVAGQPNEFLVTVNIAVILFGLPVAAAFGIGHGLLLFGDRVGRLRAALRSDDRAVRARAVRIVGYMAVAVLAYGGYRVIRAVGPDPRDRALADLTDRVSETVIAATMGRDYDESFLWGYPEYDLRASRGALARVAGEGAAVEPVLFAFDLAVEGRLAFRTRVVVLHGGAVRWASAEPGYGAAGATFASAPVLDGIARRTMDGLFGDCLPVVGRDDVAALPAAVRDDLLAGTESVERFCDEVTGAPSSDRIDRMAGDGARSGSVGEYLLVVRSGERHYALRGTWHADRRLWLGRVDVEPVR